MIPAPDNTAERRKGQAGDRRLARDVMDDFGEALRESAK
jgi:hypothetical protein